MSLWCDVIRLSVTYALTAQHHVHQNYHLLKKGAYACAVDYFKPYVITLHHFVARGHKNAGFC